jgi:hypothetical protein
VSRWGPEGPPDEAYSRVTNPERFRPLHDIALGLIDNLSATCYVERHDGYGIDDELEKIELERPVIKLVPHDASAAPLVFAFTTFPGIRVRFGYWRMDGFPPCGCDACDETADGEAGQLSRIVDAVTAGRFRETVHLPFLGDGFYESRFWWDDGGSMSNRERIDRSRARQMLALMEGASRDWKPWPHRESQSGSA